jgi:hypothetical protein
MAYSNLTPDGLKIQYEQAPSHFKFISVQTAKISPKVRRGPGLAEATPAWHRWYKENHS